MGEIILILKLLWLISIDSLCGFTLFMIWRYLDLKYFSQFEISQLKDEIEFLKKENLKLGGSRDTFWEEKKK